VSVALCTWVEFCAAALCATISAVASAAACIEVCSW
jgi:hypothetical protein